LSDIITNCRNAITSGEVEQIDLLYVHNLPESVSVAKELKTVSEHFGKSLPPNIVVTVRELGLKETEDLFTEQSSQILINEEIDCPAELKFEESGPDWDSGVLSIPGSWLRDQFLRHGDKLFSANYRGFLGVTKRKKINTGIKNTAEKEPNNFWAFNNGITILTNSYLLNKNKSTTLSGISVINGAQTTGSIGSLESTADLSKVKVLARVIRCSNPDTIANIIKFNNTQNKITTWDKFSNDSIQKTIHDEFKGFGHSYSLKRGFSDNLAEIGIENVAQPLIAIFGNFSEANRGKNGIFESDSLYKAAFENIKARHILFVYCLNRAIDVRRIELKSKKTSGSIIEIEEKQLNLLRYLRFKFFFISVFGKCLESLLGQRVDLRQVGFTPDASETNKKTINDLVVDLLPVVNIVLTYTSSAINGKEFNDILMEENPVERISNQVSSIIYATLASVPNQAVDNFRKIMVPD